MGALLNFIQANWSNPYWIPVAVALFYLPKIVVEILVYRRIMDKQKKNYEVDLEKIRSKERIAKLKSGRNKK